MRVLNVGGGSRTLPADYDGWEQMLLDIDPSTKPDFCFDAREIKARMEAGFYDAVYCSHTLEHFYRHEVPVVLEGFLHVLKPGGFAEVSVPDVRRLMNELISRNHDIDDVFYRAEHDMPITFHDVLYGWGFQVSKGNVFYAHKCGFTALSLATAMEKVGFAPVYQSLHDSNIYMKAFKKE